MAKEKYAVLLSDQFKKQIKKLAKKDQAAIREGIERIREDPFSGTPVIEMEVNKVSICPECGSRSTYTYLDVGCEPHGVYFTCDDCGESFWMYEKEYYKAREKHPELFVEGASH